ncbi:MAG: glycosyltransferase family 2 protein [Bacteroidota bacterium]|nr:glycosyltransferase family 2 protein [Bacteroidota bacterium]
MLSILIPTYNYDVFDLVQSVGNQCIDLGVPFEVLVLDDGSDNVFENPKINTLEYCSFQRLDQNIGRSAIRNLLSRKAKYDWLLFLDADTFPKDKLLIKRYIEEITKDDSPKIIYGGISYQEEKPEKYKLLRWVYGNKREALEVNMRNEDKYLTFLTLNFVIHKQIILSNPFNEKIPNLRNEDLLFSYDLQKNKAPIVHINNKVYHLGIETSEVFMQKTKELSVSYLFLWNNNLLPYDYTLYGRVFSGIKKAKLITLVGFGFRLVEKLLLRNLLGSNPSMFVYDIYRLGHICSIYDRK